MSDDTTIRAPQCGDCKSDGTRTRDGGVPLAEYMMGEFKSGTTQIAKWVNRCEHHMGSAYMSARNCGNAPPPVLKLSFVVQGRQPIGLFTIDCYGNTDPRTALDYMEKAGKSAQQIEIAEQNKRAKILTSEEMNLWHRFTPYRKTDFDGFDGGWAAELSKATGPKGVMFWEVGNYLYDSTFAQRARFRNEVFEALKGHKADLTIDDDSDDGDGADIVLRIFVEDGETPEAIRDYVSSFMPVYDALYMRLIKIVDGEEEEEEEEECPDCGADMDDCDCE